MIYQSTPLGAARARSVLLWLAAALALGGPALWWAGQRTGIQDPDDLAAGTLIYATLLAWAAYQLRRSDAHWRRLLPAPRRADLLAGLWGLPLLALSLGALWGQYLLLAALDPAYVPAFLHPDPDDLLPRSPGYRLLEAVMLVGIAPVVEEIVFRGVLLHRWAARWGLAPAALATSVAFGVLHVGVLDSIVFALAMVLLYLRHGTLWVPILAHAIHNGVVTVLAMLDAGPAAAMTVEAALAEFRAYGWLGPVGLAVALPPLWVFFRRYGPALRGWLPTPPATPVRVGAAA